MPTATPIRAACLVIAVLGLAMTPVVSATDTTDTTDHPFACESAAHNFTIEGTPDIQAQWCDADHFQPNTYAHYERRGDTEIIQLNNDEISHPNGLIQAVILHEHAHAQGFEHGDGGIANTTNDGGVTLDWRDNGTLHPTTRAVVANVSGYRVIDDNRDLLWLVNRARDTDRVTNTEVLVAVNEIQRGHELVFVTRSYSQYGGQYPDQTFRGEFAFVIAGDDS
jgi:hypothetical protein